MFLSYQVKATAENVDEAVRELPDANLVRYSSLFGLIVDAFIIALTDHGLLDLLWRFHLSL